MPKRPKTKPHLSPSVLDTPEKPKRIARLGLTRPDTPTWGFSLLDLVGPWRDDRCRPDGAALASILEHLREMEKLSWAEIRQLMTGTGRRGPRYKGLPLESLCGEAIRRAHDLELDDYETWFRFRLGNMERLWGLRQDSVFYPVWWDPNHEICPSDDR